MTTNVADIYPRFLDTVAIEALNPGGNICVLGYPEIVEDPTVAIH